MWHEARKQERRIRGLIVDYRKRAERRQDFYEKIQADPTQFIQIHGRRCKIHLDPAVAAAGDGAAIIVPWQGQPDNLIDRFDVRAHLDCIPTQPPTATKSKEPTQEERQLNYERYRILAQNDFLNVPEDKFLHQLSLEEQYGVNAQLEAERNAHRRKPKHAGATIGFNYDDPSASAVANQPFSHLLNVAGMQTNVKADSDDSDNEMDMDMSIDITKLDTSQAHELNACGRNYGMLSNDFYSCLTKDADEADALRLAREEEQEKLLLSGRKSRRERRAQKERRIAVRPFSPPSYAAKEESSKQNEEDDSDSRSPSPEADQTVPKITYITSFGNEDALQPHSKISFNLAKKPGEHAKQGQASYAQTVKDNMEKLKRQNEAAKRQARQRSRSHSRHRSRRRYHSRRRSRSNSRQRWGSRSSSHDRRSRRYRRQSRTRSRSRRRYRSPSSSSSSARSSGSSRRRRRRSPPRRTKTPPQALCSAKPAVEARKTEPSEASRTGGISEVQTQSKAEKEHSPNVIEPPPPPLKRYYGRRKAGEQSSSTSSLDNSSDSETSQNAEAKVETTSQRSSKLLASPGCGTQSGNQSQSQSGKFSCPMEVKPTATTSAAGSSTSGLGLRERLKRKMQNLINRQYKADKRAELEKTERERQQQQEREDEMRELALKLRKRERERRHQYGSPSSNLRRSRSGSCSAPALPPRSKSRSQEIVLSAIRQAEATSEKQSPVRLENPRPRRQSRSRSRSRSYRRSSRDRDRRSRERRSHDRRSRDRRSRDRRSRERRRRSHSRRNSPRRQRDHDRNRSVGRGSERRRDPPAINRERDRYRDRDRTKANESAASSNRNRVVISAPPKLRKLVDY